MESRCLVLSQLMHVQQDEPHSGAPLLQRQAVLGLFGLEKRRFWEDLISAFQYLKGAYRKDVEGLCQGVSVLIGQGVMFSSIQ